MDTIFDMLSRGVEQLLGRSGGPLHFRLFMMPTVVTILAIRAHRNDVREGRPTPLGAFFTDPAERRRLLRIALRDIGRVFVIAVVLDTIYQLLVFRWIYPVQLLIMAVGCAVVPYVLVRGPIIRLMRMLFRRQAPPTSASADRALRNSASRDRS
jgi:hypothetical protein